MARVVIVGGGFGGLAAARALRLARVDLVLVDKVNYHLFQPLLYQVATSALSATEVASPIRTVLGRQLNTTVLLDEVQDFDLGARRVVLRDERPIDYDYLVVAAGARTNYFGNLEWARVGPGLKDLDDAIEIRRRVLLAYEAAEREADPTRRRKLLSFVVIGGGPTGVEMAGALAELSRHSLSRDYRNAKAGEASVTLVEAKPRILTEFDERLSAVARRDLEGLGVRVLTEKMVTSVDEGGVHLGDRLLEAGAVIWAAGVEPRPLATKLGAELDKAGRVIVQGDCSVPGHPEVFVIGDMACFLEEGKPLPGLAPVAMQQGRAVAKSIQRRLRGLPTRRFRYKDKGVLATIGRSKAVAQRGDVKLDGRIAWYLWVFVHILYLVGFRNRVAVMADWAFAYVTYKRGAKLITGRRLEPGAPGTGREVEPSEIEVAARARGAAQHEERSTHH